ncbi:MAG TPA: amidohydrolase family protein [Ideonella sp.]|nr:amidohydrolase family protein [Ideonella sp.]
MNPRVDAHQHFWRPARGDYAWLRPGVPGLAPLCRDFLPADLQATLLAQGVVQTVLVQAADSEAETDFLLALAAEHGFIGGVVGWIDLSCAAAAETLARWAQHPKFKGVRPMLQDLPEADWIATAPHPAAMQALQRLGLRFDALVKAPQLAPLQRLLQAWPALPVVIDHAAKPALAQGWEGEWAGRWRADMARIAAHPQVMCKLSGLLTEMSPAQRRSPQAALETLRPLWHTLLASFGPARLMWGSDWPVLTLAGDYAGWVEVSETLLAELTAQEQAAVRRGNAERFYGLAPVQA